MNMKKQNTYQIVLCFELPVFKNSRILENAYLQQMQTQHSGWNSVTSDKY